MGGVFLQSAAEGEEAEHCWIGGWDHSRFQHGVTIWTSLIGCAEGKIRVWKYGLWAVLPSTEPLLVYREGDVRWNPPHG